MVLGLVRNRWTSGASGFLMGTFYALYWANSFRGIHDSGTVLIAREPLHRKHSVPFETLFNYVAMGVRDEDVLSSLANCRN